MWVGGIERYPFWFLGISKEIMVLKHNIMNIICYKNITLILTSLLFVIR